MAWLALLATLALEQAFALPPNNPVYGMAHLVSDSAARQFNAGRRRHGVYAWLALVGSAAVLCGVAFYVAHSIHWALAWAFDVVVLYFTFGFRQFSHPLTQIQVAIEAGDIAGARQQLADLKRRSDPGFRASDLPPGEIARQAIEYGLEQAHRHVFGVLFWFVLLPGPSGAVVYRLSEFIGRRWNPRPVPGVMTLPPDRFGEFAAKAYQMIDWLPARLTGLGFAIVGDFEGAIDCWRRVGADGREAVDSRTVLLATAGGALGFRVMTEAESVRWFETPGTDGIGLREPDPQGMRSAVGLVWRALVLWMLLLLMLTAVATVH
jgi:adenosylcobinamide-phosphate synthase